jgi:hypothetical protein
MNSDLQNDGSNEPIQIVNPGPSKELWDEVLTRCGFDPKSVVEYNVKPELRHLDICPDPVEM